MTCPARCRQRPPGSLAGNIGGVRVVSGHHASSDVDTGLAVLEARPLGRPPVVDLLEWPMSLEIPASSVTTAPDRRSARPPFVHTPPSTIPAPEDDAQDLKPAAVN
jgi:hypothetical protein